MTERSGRIIATFEKPEDFSGKKFVARYKLDPRKDYWTGLDEKGKHCIFLENSVRDLADKPPILEPQDVNLTEARIQELRTKLASEDLTANEINELLRKERGL